MKIPEKHYDVVSFGNALVDVQADVTDERLAELGLEKNKMQLVSAPQAAWLYNQMPPATESSGGSGANSMAVVAALGGKAGFMGRVEGDTFGKLFTHDLRAQGVAFDPYIRPVATGGTGRCLILVTPDGKRTMNTYLGTSDRAGHEDLKPQAIAEARIALFEGYMFDGNDDARQTTLWAMEYARRAGTKVAFTLSSESCIERHRDTFRHIAEHVADIVLTNDAEVMSLYQTGNFSMARLCVQRDCRTAIITKGAAGAEYISGTQVIRVPAIPGVQVVDTTGAGDAFAGGVLYSLAQKLPPTRAMRIGALCAAEVISHHGARPRADLRAFVAAGLKANPLRPRNRPQGPA